MVCLEVARPQHEGDPSLSDLIQPRNSVVSFFTMIYLQDAIFLVKFYTSKELGVTSG